VRLTREADDKSRLELSHVMPVTDHWHEYGPSAGGVGWDLSFLGLAVHIAGDAAEPKDKWSESDDGKQFITMSSKRWGDAYVTAGASPADAEATATRTTAFYTGADA
jgi:hypothetical protein